MQQTQFLQVISAREALARLEAAVPGGPAGEEQAPPGEWLGRVVSRPVEAAVDVPGFDRADLDGLAVRAADTFGADEARPVTLRLTGEVVACGVVPRRTVRDGEASQIATGGILPRGADGVVMVEHTLPGLPEDPDTVRVVRAVTPGEGVTYAGTDIGMGETVLYPGTPITSREVGLLAAVGAGNVWVYLRPRVALFSTGDEIIPPGHPPRPGGVYDSNGAVLAAALRELGCQPLEGGILPDDEKKVRSAVEGALAQGAHMVVLSGGTSKGAGDINYRVARRMGTILAHGVAIKPGKPLCLALVQGVPLVILPGFPASAMFTFYGFAAPILKRMAGLPPTRISVEENRHKEGQHREGPNQKKPNQDSQDAESHSLESYSMDTLGVEARLPLRVQSPKGRQEYLLVHLVQPLASAGGEADNVPAAYPLGKGSGSVSAFAKADGFIAIPAQVTQWEAGTPVRVHPIGSPQPEHRGAELVLAGSHCVGVDHLLGLLGAGGVRGVFLALGSMGGLAAARRGECDIAPIHLLDGATGVYNTPFLDDSLSLVEGYRRIQGLVFRPEDPRFASIRDSQGGEDPVREWLAPLLGSKKEEILSMTPKNARIDKKGGAGQGEPNRDGEVVEPECVMVNRNRGSGTRVVLDRLLNGTRPTGYPVEAKTHNAVTAAVAQGRADWGVAIGPAAKRLGLGFVPLVDESYDFVIPKNRLARPAVEAFIQILHSPLGAQGLLDLGFTPKRNKPD